MLQFLTLGHQHLVGALLVGGGGGGGGAFIKEITIF